ncbi:MAG TPA: hypothetical protein VGK88_00730 [bacterium]|jgi:hypothetical protein
MRAARVFNNEQGQLMPMVLGLLVIAAVISVAFVALVVTRQQLVGYRYRVLAARYAAEAGIERAIWELRGPDRVLGLRVPLGNGSGGRFAVESVDDQGGGFLRIVSRGEFRGLTRKVQATVKLSPGVLRYALFGDRLLRFEGSESRTYVVPASSARGCASGGLFGSNREVWIATPGVAINDFAGTLLPLRDGDQSDRVLTATGQLVLPAGAVLTFGGDHRPVDDPAELSLEDIKLGAAIVVGGPPEEPPSIDRAVLQSLAEANTANAELNEAVGRRMGRPDLRLKRNSVYEREDFDLIVRYLTLAPGEVLTGPIFVRSSAVVPDGASIRIVDGFLATEGSLTIKTGGRLEVRHSLRSRLLPGVVTIGATAPLVVQQHGTLVVDGLVYAGRIFDAGEGAVIDIVGSLMAADPLLSFRNHSATVVVRYDPAVLGTIGIRPPPGVGAVVRIVAWTEVR